MSEPQEAKQVLILRKDLKMRYGKGCAQAAHAACAWMQAMLVEVWDGGDVSLGAPEWAWFNHGTTKITVYVNSEAELLELRDRAVAAEIRHVHLVLDEGRTEFGGVATYTALALGPDWSDRVDAITRHLPLY